MMPIELLRNSFIIQFNFQQIPRWTHFPLPLPLRPSPGGGEDDVMVGQRDGGTVGRREMRRRQQWGKEGGGRKDQRAHNESADDRGTGRDEATAR